MPVNAKEVTLEHRTYQVSRENHTPSRDKLPEENLQGEESSKERYAPRRETLLERRAPKRSLGQYYL